MTVEVTGQTEARPTAGEDGGLVLADGHVHFYDCFDLRALLEKAAGNFTEAADRLQPGGGWTGCLLMSESAGWNWFERLLPEEGSVLEDERIPGWAFRRTAEPESIEATGPGGETLYLVNGRQIVVAEGLEVLALCCNCVIPDGLPMDSAVSRVKDSGGLAVVPWGAGKWWFGRGRFLKEFSRTVDGISLGDNANRPAFMGRPAHFEMAEELGIRILPGTDPLPMPGEEVRVGSFGFAFRDADESGRPAASVRAAVADLNREILPFGGLESVPRFFFNQLKINVRKRLPAFLARTS